MEVEFLPLNLLVSFLSIGSLLFVLFVFFLLLKKSFTIFKSYSDEYENGGEQFDFFDVALDERMRKLFFLLLIAVGFALAINAFSAYGFKIKASAYENDRPTEITEERLSIPTEDIVIVVPEKERSPALQRAQEELDKTKEEVESEVYVPPSDSEEESEKSPE